jgi:tRNA G18 (ribose-2'-O)-methylase SpoU
MDFTMGADPVRAFSGLRERDLKSEGIVVAEGRLLCERLLAAKNFPPLGVMCLPGLAESFTQAAGGRCPVIAANEGEMAKVTGYSFHRGALAAARRPIPLGAADFLAGSSMPTLPRGIVVLPEARDPENLGSIYRSAAALGFEAVVLGPACADPLSRRALRVSMGAVLRLPTLSAARPDELRPFLHAGFEAVGAVVDEAEIALDDWAPPERLLLAFGNEYSGLPAPWSSICSRFVTLPMAAGTDSLNLAVAAAIFMREATRHR